MLREYVVEIFKTICFIMIPYQNGKYKMALDCSKRKLTEWQWLLVGAVIFTTEFAIALVIATVSLNEQLGNIQLLISDARNINKSSSSVPSQDSTPNSPGCHCHSEGSRFRTPDYPDDVGDSQYLKESLVTESSFKFPARCCEVDTKTLRKHVKDFVRHHRPKRSLPSNTISTTPSKRKQRRSMLTLITSTDIPGQDDIAAQHESNRTPKPHLCGAHLIGQFNREFSKSNGDTLHDWTADSQGAYLMNMRYYEEDGHIRAKVPGYYYIYCQLHYILVQTRALDAEDKTEIGTSHSKRHQIRYEVIQKIRSTTNGAHHNILISNEITPNQDQRDSSYSAFESTVAYLTDRDVIFVKVWPQTHEWQYIISADHDRTYFGAVLLSESSAIWV